MRIGKFIQYIFFWEILKGLALTMKTLFKKPVTRLYPIEPRIPEPGYRGLHALVRDEKTGKERCIACGLCAAICPSQCIYIYTSEDENHTKIAERYEIEILRCLFCALCVEACPVNAIVLTDHYEYAGYSRKEFYHDKQQLLENFDKYMGQERLKEYAKKYWTPLEHDFHAYENQAVFKPKKKPADKEAA